ncbi:MAG: hypothetical protein M3Y07_02860 [Acidobacteriota bacterium]|nr:hypothetical protein [Acidobacteriota bacterium]
MIQNAAIAGTREPVSHCALGLGEQVTQQYNQPRGQTFVEEKLHPSRALRPAANRAV